MSNDLPIALRGLGEALLAILCKPHHNTTTATEYMEDVRLNLQTVGWFLFGVISHQFYLYWISDFKDSRRVKAFVTAQYCLVVLQCIVLCKLALNVYVLRPFLPSGTHFKSYVWQGLVSSVCQYILILMSNIFLANRIYTLTKSRLQSGLIIVISSIAFGFAIYTTILPYTGKETSFELIHFTSRDENATTIIWHTLQAISEFFISAFLIRALLKSRSGFKRSDSIVYYLTRHAVQLGLFAVIWSLAGMATWFLLPKYTVFAFFDMTSGSIYTHMLFDTLLSRTQLRERINERNNFEMWLPSQFRSQESEAHGESHQSQPGSPYMLFSTTNPSALSNIVKEDHHDDSDFECAAVGQTGVRYEAPFTPHDTEHYDPHSLKEIRV